MENNNNKPITSTELLTYISNKSNNKTSNNTNIDNQTPITATLTTVPFDPNAVEQWRRQLQIKMDAFIYYTIHSVK